MSDPRPPRAWTVSVSGTRVVLKWPCGATQAKDYSKGPPSKRMGTVGVAMMAKYWTKERGGVVAPCPRGTGCPFHTERK